MSKDQPSSRKGMASGCPPGLGSSSSSGSEPPTVCDLEPWVSSEFFLAHSGRTRPSSWDDSDEEPPPQPGDVSGGHRIYSGGSKKSQESISSEINELKKEFFLSLEKTPKEGEDQMSDRRQSPARVRRRTRSSSSSSPVAETKLEANEEKNFQNETESKILELDSRLYLNNFFTELRFRRISLFDSSSIEDPPQKFSDANDDGFCKTSRKLSQILEVEEAKRDFERNLEDNISSSSRSEDDEENEKPRKYKSLSYEALERNKKQSNESLTERCDRLLRHVEEGTIFLKTNTDNMKSSSREWQESGSIQQDQDFSEKTGGQDSPKFTLEIGRESGRSLIVKKVPTPEEVKLSVSPSEESSSEKCSSSGETLGSPRAELSLRSLKLEQLAIPQSTPHISDRTTPTARSVNSFKPEERQKFEEDKFISRVVTPEYQRRSDGTTTTARSANSVQREDKHISEENESTGRAITPVHSCRSNRTARSVPSTETEKRPTVEETAPVSRVVTPERPYGNERITPTAVSVHGAKEDMFEEDSAFSRVATPDARSSEGERTSRPGSHRSEELERKNSRDCSESGNSSRSRKNTDSEIRSWRSSEKSLEEVENSSVRSKSSSGRETSRRLSIINEVSLEDTVHLGKKSAEKKERSGQDSCLWDDLIEAFNNKQSSCSWEDNFPGFQALKEKTFSPEQEEEKEEPQKEDPEDDSFTLSRRIAEMEGNLRSSRRNSPKKFLEQKDSPPHSVLEQSPEKKTRKEEERPDRHSNAFFLDVSKATPFGIGEFGDVSCWNVGKSYATELERPKDHGDGLQSSSPDWDAFAFVQEKKEKEVKPQRQLWTELREDYREAFGLSEEDPALFLANSLMPSKSYNCINVIPETERSEMSRKRKRDMNFASRSTMQEDSSSESEEEPDLEFGLEDVRRLTSSMSNIFIQPSKDEGSKPPETEPFSSPRKESTATNFNKKREKGHNWLVPRGPEGRNSGGPRGRSPKSSSREFLYDNLSQGSVTRLKFRNSNCLRNFYKRVISVFCVTSSSSAATS